MFASPYIMPASRRGAQPAPVQMFKERKGSPPPYTVLPNTFLYGPRPQDRGTEVKNMRSHIKKASSKNPYPHRRAVIGVVADDWSSFDIKDAVPQRLSSSLKRLAYGMRKYRVLTPQDVFADIFGSRREAVPHHCQRLDGFGTPEHDQER